MKKDDINSELDKTLSALDDLSRASTGDEFDKRLEQKISFLPRPNQFKLIGYSVAAMFVMALLNLGTLLTLSSSNVNSDQYQNSAGEEFLYQSMDYLELE